MIANIPEAVLRYFVFHLVRMTGIWASFDCTFDDVIRATAGTAIVHLSHRNSVRPSVCLSVCLSHGWIRQKRCKLGSSNLHHRLPQRLVSGSVTLFQNFHRGHPNQGP